MGKKKRMRAGAGGEAAGGPTTAAGVARRLGVHRGTVSRALRRVSGGTSSRIGHYFKLNSSKAAAVRKVLRK